MVVALIGAQFQFLGKIEWREDIARVLWILPALLEVIQAVVAIPDVQLGRWVNITDVWKKWIRLLATRINIERLKESTVGCPPIVRIPKLAHLGHTPSAALPICWIGHEGDRQVDVPILRFWEDLLARQRRLMRVDVKEAGVPNRRRWTKAAGTHECIVLAHHRKICRRPPPSRFMPRKGAVGTWFKVRLHELGGHIGIQPP